MFENRARFILHGGKDIYLIDIEGMTPEQVVQLVPKVAKDVRSKPPSSVRTLIHTKGVKLEERMNAALKDLAAGNKPYVKASAIAGLSSMHRVVLTMVKIFARRDFHLCDTVEQAKDYLASVP